MIVLVSVYDVMRSVRLHCHTDMHSVWCEVPWLSSCSVANLLGKQVPLRSCVGLVS